MAYQRSYNPDELPRFAEPEQKPHSSSSTSKYDSKPPPPVPQPDDRSRRDGRDPRDSRDSRDSRDHHDHRDPRDLRDPRNDRDRQRLSPTTMAGFASPPPNAHGPRPTGVPQGRAPQGSRPPPSPAVESSSGSDPTLLPLFRAVDKDGTGQLSEKELSAALVNGDWTSFDPQTVRMMIRMFDADRSGTIGFDEFCGLWSFLASWRTLFDRFDVDRSGNISLSEFKDALIAFRYRLSDGFVKLLFHTYDKRGEGSMSFDLFVQACISLKRMTDVFKKYDDDRDGYITLSFEDFLTEILKQLR